VKGELGRITFNRDGTRATFSLDVMALTPYGLVQVRTKKHEDNNLID
jgi:hypothetical protein